MLITMMISIPTAPIVPERAFLTRLLIVWISCGLNCFSTFSPSLRSWPVSVASWLSSTSMRVNSAAGGAMKMSVLLSVFVAMSSSLFLKTKLDTMTIIANIGPMAMSV